MVDHAHWGLVALSFAIGLVLTLTLMVRRVKHQVPVPTSMGELGSESGTPTTTIPVTEEPPTTIPVAEESPTTTSPVAPYAPFGPGSARARADGSGPAGWLVKGRSDTRLYYTPDDPTYDSAVAQVWFKDEESAKRAYFTPWRKSSRK
ncbi:channel accessory protein ArfC, sunset domain variant [Mycobacterium haemophilum]|uniref:channel accessory protein ArfC, sunset domain variant n=1 Tax=Mycobacterium haemophilum TaxID=29311 RepID=UPI003F6850CB